jgi:diguanylate cyclase (GGDEF)-like protein
MKRYLAIGFFAIWASTAWAAVTSPVNTLRAIRALDASQARQELPVAFEATVTFFRSYEQTLFVQDGDQAIYVQATSNLELLPGDRVQISGKSQMGFSPYVSSSNIVLLHHGVQVPAQLTTFDDLLAARYDCRLVSVWGVIRSADMVSRNDVRGPNLPMHRSVRLQVLTDGGYLDAFIDSTDAPAFERLIDAEVEISGAAAGSFDGKMQQTGVQLYVPTMDSIKVLNLAAHSAWSLPVAPMDQIISAYHVRELTRRVRVHGVITYYQPGSGVTLQDGTKSLWVSSQIRDPLFVGDIADAIGFPDAHNGFLTLSHAEVKDSHIAAPIRPQLVAWSQLVKSGKLFDLVSIEARVVTAVRQATQDEYVLQADGQVFSAIIRHPTSVDLAPVTPLPMKTFAPDSMVRVTGICVLQDSNPFNTEVPFSLLMRSFDDINVVADPPWLNMHHLTMIAGLLLGIAIAGGVRSLILSSQVRHQAIALNQRVQAEAALERSRSAILEDINGSRPLNEILEHITGMVSFKLDGAPCWCRIDDESLFGCCPADAHHYRVIQEEIPGRSGMQTGKIFAALDPLSAPTLDESEALSSGAKLATLAVETRRLYSDLRHRSEFDLLTDIHNRFSLERHLDALIANARKAHETFALIYIDLDDFKLVNDRYGHLVGDLYLQEVARRMKNQLRVGDLLARVGGDEFAVLAPQIPGRAEAEEIACRLQYSFDAPIEIDEICLQGTASIGAALFPEDGGTKDGIFSAADEAMYVVKNAKRARMAASTEV